MLLTPVGIQKRASAAILGTGLLVFLVFYGALRVEQNVMMPQRVSAMLKPYADLIIVSATPAVAKDDPQRAREILSSLGSNAQILRADILRADGTTLATYPDTNGPLDRTNWARPDGVYLDGAVGELVGKFTRDDPRSARLFVRLNVDSLHRREEQALKQIALAVGLILCSFVLLQFILLRRWVLSPVAQLAAIAENVGKQGDFSARMPAHGRDELGQLGQRFNALLAAVEQRERELRKLADFQRAIVTDAGYGIISTDKDGIITSVNPAAAALLGWQPAELVGKATVAILHLPEELAAQAQLLSKQLGHPIGGGMEALVAEARQGLHSETEWTYLRKDGLRFPGLTSVTALRDERGEIFGFLGIIRDITERRRAEAQLRERETQYRLLFENMITGFALHEIICDPAGRPVDYRYLEVNPAFERLTGLVGRDLVGRTVREVHPAVDQHWIDTFGTVALTGQPIAYENYFDDLGRCYDTWVFCPKPRQFAVVFSDVTARKQAEESLLESQRSYEELVASLPLGVYRITLKPDDQLAFEYVSERFCEITGIPRATVLADPAAVANIIHPEERETFTRREGEAIAQRATFLWEGRAIVQDQPRWLRIEARPALLPDRAPFWTGVIQDVTDRRGVEEALHHQHSLLEGALQATADGILAVSSDGHITSYNRQFLELWRVPREILDAHDLDGLADYILQQLANPSAVQARIRQFNDTSKADTFDTLEFSDGRVYERFSRPQSVDGLVVGRVWSFRDVTARHWAVASLRESEHKFKMLFEAGNDAILILSNGVFLDCNRVSETMFACPRERIIGLSLAHFSPERQADGRLSVDAMADCIEATLGGHPQFFEWIHAREDGTLFNAEVTLNRLELRGQTLVQVIVRDITARKQAESAQHEAEQLYRTLVNTSPDGISLLDMKGHLLYASPKAVELFYGSAEAEVNMEQSALHYVSHEFRAQAAAMLQAALAGKFPANERLVMRRTDDHEFVAEVNGTLLRDSLGVPWGLLIITRDVTERQHQEDELKGKNTELERFTYTVSHDLKSPLITIKGFAGTLLADVAAGRTDRVTDDLKRIVQAADKMADLLNGLLKLSRVGRIVNPPEAVSMTALAADVVELLAGLIAQRQARVTVQPDLPPANGDPQRLQEVLQNLIENALKFSAPGVVPEIEIGFKMVDDQPAYFVRDHGRGIEERFHQSIFGLFNKLDPRTEGTGIGLALVRRIVEYHGGTIWVESAGRDQGSTFYFTLPGRKALSPGQ